MNEINVIRDLTDEEQLLADRRGVTFEDWRELLSDAADVPDPDRLLAEIGGPAWVEAYSMRQLGDIARAAVAVKNEGVKGLLSVTGLTQRELSILSGYSQRAVENWCAVSESVHRDCPDNVLYLVSYAVLRDVGIL